MHRPPPPARFFHRPHPRSLPFSTPQQVHVEVSPHLDVPAQRERRNYRHPLVRREQSVVSARSHALVDITSHALTPDPLCLTPRPTHNPKSLGTPYGSRVPPSPSLWLLVACRLFARDGQRLHVQRPRDRAMPSRTSQSMRGTRRSRLTPQRGSLNLTWKGSRLPIK